MERDRWTPYSGKEAAAMARIQAMPGAGKALMKNGEVVHDTVRPSIPTNPRMAETVTAQKTGISPVRREMDPHALIGTEDRLKRQSLPLALKSFLTGRNRDYAPDVVHYQGRDYISDGHHRVEAAIAAGANSLPVNYYNADEANALQVGKPSMLARIQSFVANRAVTKVAGGPQWQDEPREEHGRWTAGTGGESPGTGHGDIRSKNLGQLRAQAGAAATFKAAARAVSVNKSAQEAERTMTPTLQRIADRLGGRMQGLAFKFKSVDSLQNKMLRRVVDAKAAGVTKDVNDVHVGDALRYTMEFPTTQYAAGVFDAVDALRAAGLAPKALDYRWDQQDYGGIHVSLTAPNGQEVELQFHTRPGWDAKMTTEPDYAVASDPATPEPERQALFQKAADVWAKVPQPRGITALATMGLT